MNYEAVIFDFDGTLADTARDVWLSLAVAAEEAGGRLREGFSARDSNLSLPLKDIFAAIEPFPGPERFESFSAAVERHYRRVSRYERTELYPGIAELLRRLKSEGVPSFIVSQKPCEALSRILRIKQWGAWFDAWLSPDSFSDLSLGKAALISLLLEDRLKGRRAVYIGDSWTDAVAARESGVDFIGAAYGDGDPELLAAESPLCLVRDPRMLGECL
jgi:phosphoglycolate phosphatase-like HAD superfamily hydrolase